MPKKLIGSNSGHFLNDVGLLWRHFINKTLSLTLFIEGVSQTSGVLLDDISSPEWFTWKKTKSVIRKCPKVLILDKLPNELNKRFESPMCTTHTQKIFKRSWFLLLFQILDNTSFNDYRKPSARDYHNPVPGRCAFRSFVQSAWAPAPDCSSTCWQCTGVGSTCCHWGWPLQCVQPLRHRQRT